MTEKWTELAIGIIMIASPWVLGFSDISLAKWCNVLIGLLLVLLGARTMFGKMEEAMPAAETSQEEKSRKK